MSRVKPKGKLFRITVVAQDTFTNEDAYTLKQLKKEIRRVIGEELLMKIKEAKVEGVRL